MKRYRYIAFILAMVFVLSSCAGISDGTPEDTSDSGSDTDQSINMPIPLSEYKIVRPANGSDYVVDSAVALRRGLGEYFGGMFPIGDDWLASGQTLPESATEILVGPTNRPESQQVVSELLAADYAVKYFSESGRIVICGGTDEATAKAVSYFLEFCIDNSTGTASVSSELSFFSNVQYAVSECLLGGVPISEYTLVTPNSADADEKYAAELICLRVLENTGVKLDIVKESNAPNGRLILIGEINKAPSRLASLEGGDAGYVLGAEGDNVIVCGDGGMTVYAARQLLNKLFPTGQSTVSVSLSEAKTSWREVDPYPQLTDFGDKSVALADQLNASIAVYDLSSGSDPVLKYELKPNKSKGFSLNGYGNRVDEARLRYSKKWGTYIICFTSSSGYVGIAGYPSEECLWEVELKGTSPHSIEYLPNGTVAVASSGGSDTSKGFIRLYSTEKGKNDARYAEAQLTSAHAVLWDETREILWAMGSTNIVAYEVGNDAGKPTLTKIASYGCSQMKGGHDLSAMPGNDDLLWVGGSIIRVFDKTTGALSELYDGAGVINASNVKCICSYPDGTVVRTVATGVYAEHNTDKFDLYTFMGGTVKQTTVTFPERAFYKARVFLAPYN